jgi:hypothetical protein
MALGAAGGGQAVVTRPGGYCLQLADGRLDVSRFERLVAQGRSALAGNQPGPAADSLRAALRLWRGNALSDFSYEPFAQVEMGGRRNYGPARPRTGCRLSPSGAAQVLGAARARSAFFSGLPTGVRGMVSRKITSRGRL